MVGVFCLSQNEIYFTEYLQTYYNDISLREIIRKIIYPLMTAIYFLFLGRFIDYTKEVAHFHILIYFNCLFYFIYGLALMLLIVHGYTSAFHYFYFIGYIGAFVLIPPLLYMAKNHINYLVKFAFWGSSFLYIGSISFALSEHGFSLFDSIRPINFLVCCILLEITVFLIGLGYRDSLLNKKLELVQEQNIQTLQKKFRFQSVRELNIRKAIQKQSSIIEVQKNNEISAQYEKEISALKIKTLRSQMNPHFLFNSLNTLKLMILKEDLNKIESYFSNFTDLLRKILDHSEYESISLNDELEALKLYVDIEKERFSFALDYEVNIFQKINTKEVIIPTLLIQPFIENAIWHGLLPLKKRKPLLQININLIEQFLTVEVRDNGVGRKKVNDNVSEHNSLGVKMIQERIHLLNKHRKHKPIDLSFFDLKGEDDQPIGTSVVISLLL